MLWNLEYSNKCILGYGLALAMLLPLGFAHAKGFSVLYSFQVDSAFPRAGLLEDAAGNLFGTTSAGGNCGVASCGTIFRLASDGSEDVLYTFKGGSDGLQPEAGLIADKKGHLYGTTSGGGGSKKCAIGCGTVFKLAADGTEKVLHAFTSGDGAIPESALMERGANLYGTTVYGGGTACTYGEGCGTVFELAADGTFTVLHFFQGGTDGANPLSGLIADKNGNLYGTTSQGGGATSCADGCGTVFRLAPDGTETVLYSFQNGSDGWDVQGSVIMDDAGNLYGTTSGGGGTSCGCGTVFKLAPDGIETILHSFAGGSDGAYPAAGVIPDKAGNLYGTTIEGGNGGVHCSIGCGTVFKFAPHGEETVLHAFRRKLGAYPVGGLIADKSGYIYGTTQDGGDGIACTSGGHHIGCGTIFRLKK